MCGIAGLLTFGRATDARSVLEAMRAAQYHRGPDASGIRLLRNGCGGLANCRLAVCDLSPAGHMPMSDDTGRIAISYNGEIYNAAELRAELECEGFVFHSHGDTETVLHGYEAWGEPVVERLRGMFAFAITDERPDQRKLLLARDRLGIKPLYYTAGPAGFLFASEIKALHAAGLIGSEIDSAGLVGYLMLGSVPNPLTIYRGVRGLEPASTLTVSLDDPVVSLAPRRYWIMPVCERTTARNDAIEEVRALLLGAVCEQLVGDVPIGAFLSGGLDSTILVGLMRRAGADRLRTCSIAFTECEYDEARPARQTAEVFGTEHVERTIGPDDLRRELPAILAAMDQPTVDGVNTYFVSETAKQAGLTVALSGLGGDELFGGYQNTFQGVPILVRAIRAMRFVPGATRLVTAGVTVSPQRERLRKAADALTSSPGAPAAYLARRGLFSHSEARMLAGEERWREAAKSFEPLSHIASRSVLGGRESRFETRPFSWISRAELGTYTHHQLLRDTDVMSMAHSLEVRVPLLDHRLVEAVLTLPDAIKRDGDRPKALLADAASGLCPPGVLAYRPKQGFTFPMQQWLRGPLSETLDELVVDVGTRQIVNRASAERIVSSFCRGHMHWSRLWALAALAAVRGTS